MHRLFISEGIVLGKKGVGESNTLVAILTKEFGLLRASAKSARRENSKLRYGLEPLTLGTFSFVRGRHEWKLTNSHNLSHELIAKNSKDRQSAGRVTRLLLRLIHGEETNQELYTSVALGLRAIAHGVDVEAVLVLRVLSHLGYLPHTPELEPFIKHPPAGGFFSLELAKEAEISRKLLIKAINESLGATGL
jgi:DNA repair protein RecO (recombination protein O)